ncbi:hypothetical protein [Kitasatospora sp. NPDC051914]|uniref:hypothetical protein n=1 Tax=Kitasatospora sp. NPDC051914 TaxID=3154945 RepID=UPI003422EDF6
MQIHRTEHIRCFTVLPNGLLQDRSLSYTARGLLADLLSRPDGRREDARSMADTSPQGRAAVSRALKELIRAGYYRIEKIRLPDGTIRSVAHVYDTPHWALPDAVIPGPGPAAPGLPVASLVKNPEKEPTLPAAPELASPVPASPVPDEQTRAAVAALYRAIRPEPRLHIGEAEALGLAPLVARWLERGATAADLAHTLLPGLPSPLHSPAALLRNRLQRKEPVPVPAAAPRYAECARCHDPVPTPGICRPCAGLPAPSAGSSRRPETATTGAARARAALLAARSLGPALLR